MCDETREERQDNELAALQAIYGDDVVDNREALVWKIWRPLDILLTLHPLHNSDVKGDHCFVTLHIKCCPLYPDRPPKLSIEKQKGLSTENCTKLLSELETLASDICGEVMIFELAQHVQQFLHDHYKPTLSCYEEMNVRNQLKVQDIQSKENEERQKIKDEIQKRKEMLRDADRKIHRSSTSQENSNEGQGDAPELVYYADTKISPAKKTYRNKVDTICTCNLKGTQTVRITQKNNRKVYIGNCLGHSSNGATTYLAIDDETGEYMITKKWTIPTASDFQTRNRQLKSLQQDLNILSHIKHNSLVPYVFMESVKENKKTGKQSYFVFRNFVHGYSLKYLLSAWKCKFSDKYEALKLLRSVALGLFAALKELHSVSVVHRDVRSENLFVDVSGGVKLVGAGLDARLAEMHEGDSYCSRQTQAQDIYAAAQLLLSIFSYEATMQEVPSDLPGSAKDFFSRCLTDDEHSQWTAEQLVNHGFLVDQPTKQPNEKLKDEGSCSEDDEQVKKIPYVSPSSDGQSRLNAEFEVLTWLGKGAFGDVVKVKNKLDGGSYAIKRIKLNPESVQLNKKITREVKLLSRLNHENVVRYYNAWIESTVEAPEYDDTTSTAKSPTRKKPGDSLAAVVAKLGQEIKVEWSISENVAQNRSSDSEEEDDDDEQEPWLNINPEDESSSGIEFEVVSNQSETIPSEAIPETPRPQSIRLHQVLFIQMEFCEKHTLRQAIDNGLYQEHFRAWRLFREIVEGLAHVHQRGMIHRDLKPVNIFLDSNDHVKIGDFGLATKAFTGLPIEDKSKQHEEIGGSMTGQVGTALYVAPELLQAAGKVIYNQKVDIYSLGIILFEMFHPPLSTGTERIMVLTNLRTKDILMPKSFEKEENAKQIHVIRWLLNHDASVRPTCAELLASEHVPRPVPEGALSGLLAHTLNDRGTRCYQRLIAACLDQRLSAAEDITYHGEIKSKPVEMLEILKDNVIRVFKSHGATEFSPPLLMPRSKYWDQHPNAVKVMTASGAVCHLPHDLRLPFARHVAYSGTKYMRRYVVDRVYREKHLLGFHPREMVECAFDIVTPKNDSLWSDAELLMVANRCAGSMKVILQLNHTELLRILLLSCGVPQDKHADLYPVLVDRRFELLMVANRCAGSMKVILQLNHTELLRILLLSCGVPQDKHADLYPVLVDRRFALWSDAELLMVANRCAGSMKVILQLNHTELLRILLLSCGVPQDKHADLYPVLVDRRFALWSDAELLMVANRCAGSMKVILQLNHTELLRILLLSCGVPQDKHADLYPVLVDRRFGRITNLQLQTHLTSLCVTNNDVINLLRLMEADVEVKEVRELVTSLVKQAKWAKMASRAVTELEAVYRNARALGCECPMTVAPFLAYNATQHSGVFWQMSVVRNDDHRPSKHRAGDVIAAGGRYDVLVGEFWKVANDNAELKCSSVGFSLSLERMAAIFKKMETELPPLDKNPESTLICVCVWGTSGSGKDGIAASRRAQLARDLWGSGFNCCPCPPIIADVHELSKAEIVVREDGAAVRVCWWGSDRVLEHKVPYIDVIDVVKQKLQPDTVRSPEGSSNRTISCNESEKSNSPNTSVTFITASERMTKNSKRHSENQINTQITSMLVNLGLQSVLSRVRVHVVALACEARCVRALAAALTAPLHAEDMQAAFNDVSSSFPKRKDILAEAMEELEALVKQGNQNRSTEETQLYALYSLTDSLCRLIT